VIERELGLPGVSDQNSWAYDDKIGPGLFTPGCRAYSHTAHVTWFDRAGARNGRVKAVYRLCLKLAAGAGSTNVRLVRDVSRRIGGSIVLFNWRLVVSG